MMRGAGGHKRLMHSRDGPGGAYQPGPTLKVGSVHFNAIYDGDTIKVNEDLWHSKHSLSPPDKVLTFSRVDSATYSGGSSGMVLHREAYDILPNEPVFMCTGYSPCSRQQRHGCFVLSSLNHMCITDDDVLSMTTTSGDDMSRSALAFAIKAQRRADEVTGSKSLLSTMKDAQRREILQRKYRLRFVGFSIGSVTNADYLSGKNPHLACNAGGLMTVKADEVIESGQYVVVDLPMGNLDEPTQARTNRCCASHEWRRANAVAQGDDCSYLEGKVTLVVRPLRPDTDFASMSRPYVHAAAGHTGCKYPPWIVGQCVRGCSQPGMAIDLVYTPSMRFPNYITLLSPPPFYMNRGGGGGGGGGGGTNDGEGTTYGDIYAASVRKLLMRRGTGGGGGGGGWQTGMSEWGVYDGVDGASLCDGGGGGGAIVQSAFPSMDCQDLMRHMLEVVIQRESETEHMDNGEVADRIHTVSVDTLSALTAFIDTVASIAYSVPVKPRDEVIGDLQRALLRACDPERKIFLARRAI